MREVVADYAPDRDRIVVTAAMSDRDLMRTIPGARFHFKSQTWSIAAGLGAARALRNTFGERLVVTDSLDVWGWGQVSRLEAVAKAKQDESPHTYAPHLRPYQRSGAMFLSAAKQALLADEMGTGKTIQALAAITSWPALVVCTNAMKYEWEREARQWVDRLDVIVVDGAATKRRKALERAIDEWEAFPLLVVVGWGSIRLHSRLAPYGSIKMTEQDREPKELNAIPWGTVIIDEAHRMAHAQTQQTRAAWALLHSADYRYALTGSPVTDTPETIWPIMHGLAPEEYPTRSGWIDRYALSGYNFFGALEITGLNPATRDEFFEFFDARFFRRTKAEVLPDLPPKVYSIRHATMQPKQAKAYESMRKHMVAELESGILFATNPLTKMARLVQCAAAVPVLEADGQVSALSAPSCKVDALLDIVDEAGGESLVVFTVSRKLADLVCEKLDGKCVRVTGTENAIQRANAVAEFQAGKVQIIVCTMGAGGEGITLTRASRVVFLQRSFRAVDNVQAEDRVHRFGQEAQSVQIIDVITDGTVEDRVHQLSAEKRSHMQEIVRDPVFWKETVL